MESIHFLNGKFVSEKELLISPRDLGYSRGYGVFDFLITYRHKPFMLQRHIDRLFRSAEAIALSIPWTKEEVTEWVLKTLEANEAARGEKVIRIMISGGPSLTLISPVCPTIVITIDSNVSCSEEAYKNGVEVILVEFQRYRPEAKTNNYIEAIRSINSTNTLNIDEFIYHSEGVVHEGSRCNVFAVIEGKLLTPKTNILEGITREVLLEILRLEIPATAENFSVEAFRSASEVFLSATGKEVMPVTKINGVSVGNGQVGSITKEVMKQHDSFIHSDLW